MCKIKVLDTKKMLQTRPENAALHTAIVVDILPQDQGLSIVEQKVKQKLITSKNRINTISLWNSIREDIKYEIKN